MPDRVNWKYVESLTPCRGVGFPEQVQARNEAHAKEAKRLMAEGIEGDELQVKIDAYMWEYDERMKSHNN